MGRQTLNSLRKEQLAGICRLYNVALTSMQRHRR